METKKKKILLWVIAVSAFVVSLYLVEASPFGSAAVAAHNGGYGTFDMKSYNPDIVQSVLEKADADYLSVCNRYYLADFLFIACFGLFQCFISTAVYGKDRSIMKRIAVAVPIARGVFDIVENSILLFTINTYPQINPGSVTIASVSTVCKLWCIRIWVILVAVGILFSVYRKLFRNQLSQKNA